MWQDDRDSFGELASPQDGLRRVATLVARGAPPSEVFVAVAEEMAGWLHAGNATVARIDDDGTYVILAQGHPDTVQVEAGLGQRLSGAGLAARVLRTGRPARIDNYDNAPRVLAEEMREYGIYSSAGAPLIVNGRVWGMAAVANSQPDPLPPGIEDRIAEFADLAATAIVAAATHAELIASRARIVAASDEARRRIERDLHDGAQQRLVALGLKVRSAIDQVPAGLHGLNAELSDVASGLTAVLEELREISHGIHPAILSSGGWALH